MDPQTTLTCDLRPYLSTGRQNLRKALMLRKRKKQSTLAGQHMIYVTRRGLASGLNSSWVLTGGTCSSLVKSTGARSGKEADTTADIILEMDKDQEVHGDNDNTQVNGEGWEDTFGDQPLNIPMNAHVKEETSKLRSENEAPVGILSLKFVTCEEDEKIVEAMVDVLNSGSQFKSDNGFKPRFLIAVANRLAVLLPDSGIKAKPHVKSLIKTLKSYWVAVHDMLAWNDTSSFGWDYVNNMLDAPQPVWKEYEIVQKEKKQTQQPISFWRWIKTKKFMVTMIIHKLMEKVGKILRSAMIREWFKGEQR
nr:hypothetical protein [Tanacetum cinerariifolium]